MSGALVQNDGNGGGVDASSKIDLTLLMEQYLDGDEVDVDVVMSEGDWRYAAVSDNGPTLEPYFNETWALSPSLMPKQRQTELRELAVGCLHALGFSAGVFHVECKYTSTGPQLIEVNARMGGGQVHQCNLSTWGVDLVEETIFVALGIPSRPVLPKQPLTSCAYSYLCATKTGVASHDEATLEKVRQRDGVLWAKTLVKTGDRCVGPADGLPTWLLDMFITGKTSKDAFEALQAIEEEEPVNVQN